MTAGSGGSESQNVTGVWDHPMSSYVRKLSSGVNGLVQGRTDFIRALPCDFFLPPAHHTQLPE